jgi:hypothetical protein
MNYYIVRMFHRLQYGKYSKLFSCEPVMEIVHVILLKAWIYYCDIHIETKMTCC